MNQSTSESPTKPHKPVIPFSNNNDTTDSREAYELVRNSRLRCSLPVPSSTVGRPNFSPSPKSQILNQRIPHRSHPRKAVIPITSRQTSLVVLNNVDVESVPADLRFNECLNFTKKRASNPQQGVASNGHMDSKESEVQNNSSDSLSIDSMEASDKMLTLQNDWKNIRTSSFRYSTSSFGSSASEDDIWIPRNKN